MKKLHGLGLRRTWRRWFGWRWFRGDYRHWSDAHSASIGYDDGAVFERVLDAARAARDGRAAWDRDGTEFNTPEVNRPLVEALRASVSAEDSRLNVIDFGGGLGGTWRQNRSSFLDVAEVRWCIVEQRHFVDIGNKEFSDEVLSFEPTFADACASNSATVVILSSVLQYVANPHEILAEVSGSGINHVIIDRIPFWEGGRDRLTIQVTPNELGGGSYPCWLFHRDGFIASLSKTYDCAGEWPGFDDVDRHVQFRGMYFRRKSRQA